MSTYRLEVRKGRTPISVGTAWQIGTNLFVTAFHVVGKGNRWMHEAGDDVGYYLLNAGDASTHSLQSLDHDSKADIAVLESRIELRTSSLSPSVEEVLEYAPWRADGFPTIRGEKDFRLTGRVARVRQTGGADDLQLVVDQGTSVSWEGASGAAVCIGGQVVGILTDELGAANTVHAASILPLRTILQRKRRAIAFSNFDADRRQQNEFLRVVEMTRADRDLLAGPRPAAAVLAISSFLNSQSRIEENTGAWLLLWAAQNGLHKIVKQLLDAGCLPDWRVDESPATFDLQKHELAFFWPGGTALHMAAGRGCVPVMRHLIERGAVVDSRDRKNATPLHRAAKLREEAGRAMILRAYAVAQKFGELQPDSDDELALQAVQFLLSKGADPGLTDGNGQSAVELAADYPEMLEAVLTRTAVGVQPALWTAASHLRKASINLLLGNGSNLNHPDGNGDRLLKRAILQTDSLKTEEYRTAATEIVKHLLDCGADVNLSDPDGDSALHAAVRINATSIVEALLRQGADPNAKCRWRDATPLFDATSSEVSKMLLSCGADASLTDAFGFRAIDIAVVYDRTDVLETMEHLGLTLSDITHLLHSIRAGSDLSLTPSITSIDLSSACDLNGDPIAFWACRVLNIKALRFLLDRGIPVDVTSRSGVTLLAEALRSGAWQNGFQDICAVATLLREFGADPTNDGQGIHCCFSGSWWWRNELIAPWVLQDVRPELRDKNGKTPLMRAVADGLPGHVQILIRRGADVNATDHKGKTALFHLIYYDVEKDLQKAKLLLDAGAELDMRDQSGMTPLMTAALAGKEAGARWLIENGAKRELLDDSGKNAYDWAIQNTRLPELINMLHL